ncbi:MAG: ABC transporter permease [bacterium]
MSINCLNMERIVLIRRLELLWFLTKREIVIRYKQTLLGSIWIILQPLLVILTFSIVFRKNITDLPYNIPYSIYVFSGLIFWNFFRGSIITGQTSLLRNINIITKIYFPRIIIILSSVFAYIIDLLIILIMFFLFAWFKNVDILDIHLLLIFIPLVIGIVLIIGITIILSILVIFFRDVQYIVAFLMQILLFLTPIIYSSKFLPEKYRFLIDWSPVSIIINNVRSVLFEGSLTNLPGLIMTFLYSSILLILAVFFLIKTERIIGDFK